MGSIKVDSDTLLVLANSIYDFKEELCRFTLDVGKIEDKVALIVDVNMYKLKNELADFMNCTYLFSRKFENLAEGLCYASREYEDADKKIKDSIGSMTKLHMNDIASLIKNGVDIPLPLFIPNEYADYEDYLISEDEAKEYFTMGVLGTGIVNGLKAKTMPAKIAYKKNGHLYIYALCEVPEVDPIFGGEIKIPHDGFDSKMVEQITNYKYEQVYTNEPQIKRLDGVIPFGVDGGHINKPATVGELIEFMNKREGVSARFASGDEEAYLKFVGAEASHMMMVDGTSDMIFRKDVSSRWTALHEWLHRYLQTKNGEITPGEDRIIESFLERHKEVLRIGNK